MILLTSTADISTIESSLHPDEVQYVTLSSVSLILLGLGGFVGVAVVWVRTICQLVFSGYGITAETVSRAGGLQFL